MLCRNNTKIISSTVRVISTSSEIYTNHYDALGITPKATQGDIKSAYYKLSKVYHPDKSEDETSAKKFRAITEAYEVLGNIKLKKMYDKGLLVGRENTSRMEYEPEPEPADPTLKFYKSRNYRNIVPTIDGRTPIYDFDSWSKHHYGNLFEKKKYEKEFNKVKNYKSQEIKQSANQELVIFVIFLIVGAFVALAAQGRSEYDSNKIMEKKNAEKQQQKVQN